MQDFVSVMVYFDTVVLVTFTGRICVLLPPLILILLYFYPLLEDWTRSVNVFVGLLLTEDLQNSSVVIKLTRVGN